MAQARRNAADLWVRGKHVNLADDQGNSITLYVRKLDDLDQKTALRKANAARARRRAALADHESDEYLSLCAEVDRQFGREMAVDLLAGFEVAPRRVVIEAQVASEENSEWAKDDYLTGLMDSWVGEMQERFAEDADDPQAKHVIDEITRFNSEVDAIFEAEEHVAQAQFGGMSDEELREKMVELFIETELSTAFVDRYHECQIWLASRDAHDHEKYHFESLERVQRADRKVKAAILLQYDMLEVDMLEGKDLPGNPDSSGSSDSPEAAEGSEPSSLVAVST